MKHKFNTRKEVTEYLKTKDIDTNDWSEEKWLSINKGQGEIHIMDLAEKMWDAMNESTPKELKEGEWHMPFGDNLDRNKLHEIYLKEYATTHNPDNPVPDYIYVEALDSIRCKIATARCARISYETLGDNPKIDYEADIKLHDMLLASKHASPFEHVCMVPTKEEYDKAFKGEESGWFYNLKGFKSYRFSLGV